jgi:mannose-1-phosphate guanylyltransferase/mannose-6-phosphate isomerase
MKIRPIILAGGIGERLWPISRELAPKQFNENLFDVTLFEETILRCKSKIYSDPIIVTNQIYKDKVLLSLRSKNITTASIILESEKRNTAPAIISALQLLNSDEVLSVLSSDHMIGSKKQFNDNVQEAAKSAIAKDEIIIFGVKPSSPHTGYGYIESTRADATNGIHKVRKFHEKPDAKTAKKYLKSNKFYWNCGIFILTAKFLSEEAQLSFPKFWKELDKKNVLELLSTSDQKLNFYKANNTALKSLPAESFDVAVLEKTDRLSMIIARFNWSDLGTWNSYHALAKKDVNGNYSKGKNVCIDSANSLIISTKSPIVADGIDGLVIINTGDVTYVGQKDSPINIKKVRASLLKNNNKILKQPDHEIRPWGEFESLDRGSNFQVKRITVKPGQKLSTQSHLKRSEHWIVTEGIAHVYLNKNVTKLKANDHFFIPKKGIHSLENRQQKDLIIIELQYGSYLGEDDIVRYDDKYGR